MATPSDAFVFFGATGDLAYKQIFPSLQAMVKAGTLDVPVIGVAKAGWDLDQLKKRAQDSLEEHGGVHRRAFAKLKKLMRYVDGDYADPDTFTRLREELGRSRRPLHYLAIPPSLFGTVAQALNDSGCAPRAPASWSRSRSGTTWPRPRRSTASCTRSSRRTRSSASTTTWARSRSRTSPSSASPTASSSRSGTATTSPASR